MKVRKLQEPRGWAWYVGPAIIKPLLLATTTQQWVDGEKLPAEGGFVVAMNHLSHVDPLTAAHLLYDHGRLPRYLAKSGLFSNKMLGYFLRAAGQIPVERATSNAAGAYMAAVEAVREGKCVVVYPEGTITRDPDGWPMVGKSGAARIALETGCPVFPVGQWGAQELLPAYSKRPHLMPRTRIAMKVGDPVDLHDLVDQPRSLEVVNEATARIMSAITALVEDIRHAEAPTTRYDMRVSGDPYRPGASESATDEPQDLGTADHDGGRA